MDSYSNREKREMNKSKIKSHFPPIYVPAQGKIVSINPIEGRNYNADVIEYMASPKVARKIREIILYWSTNQCTTENYSLTFVDASAGVGGATRFFLEPSESCQIGAFSKVIAYEINDDRRQMLANNLEDYGFDNNRYDLRGEFLGVPLDLVENGLGPIVMFDPPWTSMEIPGQYSAKNDYIKAGITFAGQTMEQWVSRCWHCTFITIRGPPGYVMEEVQGFGRTAYDLENSGIMYLYWPDQSTVDRSIPNLVEPSKPANTTNKNISLLSKNLGGLSFNNSSLEQLTKTKDTATSPIITNKYNQVSTDSIKYGNKDISKMFYKIHGKDINKDIVEIDHVETSITVNEWEELLQDLLRNIFIKIIPDSEIVEKFVGPETIEIWKRSFTAQNVNPNPEENYEPLEKLGDKVMGSSFALYMLHKFPGIDQAQINDLDSIYVSKINQAELSKKLDLGSYVRRIKELAPKKGLWEDVLESLFGAIILASEKAFGNQTAGYGIAYNLMVYLYEPFNIQLSDAVKSIVNFVKESLEKIGLQYFQDEETNSQYSTVTKRIIIVYRETNDQQRYTKWIKDNLYEGTSLVQKGINHWNNLAEQYGLKFLQNNDYILSDISGIPAEMTKDVINNRLFNEAYESLKRLGLDSNKADIIGDMKNLDKDYLVDLKDQLMNKLVHNGYVRPTFKRIQKDLVNISVMTLFGVLKDGTKEPLVSAGGVDDQNAERNSVIVYLDLYNKDT